MSGTWLSRCVPSMARRTVVGVDAASSAHRWLRGFGSRLPVEPPGCRMSECCSAGLGLSVVVACLGPEQARRLMAR